MKSSILQVNVDCFTLHNHTTQPQPPEILPEQHAVHRIWRSPASSPHIQNLDNTPFNQKQVPYHSYIRWKYHGNTTGNSLVKQNK